MPKFLQVLLSSLLLLLLSTEVKGSHVVGAELTYQCVNACTLEVTFRAYRDCSGVMVIGNNITWNGTTPGCTPPPPIGPWSAQLTAEVTPICPSVPTRCTNPSATISGIEEFTWSRNYDICAGTPCIYQLVWSDCCRNSGITSLTNSGSLGLYTENTLVNTTLATCNSSPVYTTLPLFIACEGTDHDIHQGAYDPDGDSLVYSLGACYQSAGTQVAYAIGYSPTAPLGPSWNVTIDPVTGMLHMGANPGNGEVGVICVMIEEYRNGVIIATHQRDIQVTTLACPLNDPATFTAITNLTTGSLVGDHIYLCGPTPFCFDIGTNDINVGQSLVLAWDQNLAGATFSEVGNPSVMDTISGTSALPPAGQFCWTPLGVGTYQFRLRVEDNACPILGPRDKMITIHVGSAFGASATATPTTCPSAYFMASGCGAGPFTFTWSGAGGLTGSTASLSHTYAAPGSYAWQVIVDNGLAADTVTGTVVVGGAPSSASLFTGAIAFASPCSGVVTDTLFGPAGYASYQWSNGATTQDQIVFLGGDYHLTVTDAAGCQFTDSTTLYWAEPDIYGIVDASTGAPLQNQKIYLIEHDTILQALNAVDSVWTDSSGYYYFCNVTDTNVFLKAAPLVFDYPNELPTYADTTLFWNSAIAFTPLTMSPFQHDFSTLFGANPGGPGFIGGLISQGANKTAGVGDPVPNVRIFLRDMNSGMILGSRVTDVNGYFVFNSVPLGDYEFAVDVPNVDELNVPQLTLDAQNMSYDSLDFRLHSTYLELVMTPPVAIVDPSVNFSFGATPNPFGSTTKLALTLEADGLVDLQILDVFGKRVQQLNASVLKAGMHQFEVGADLAAGIYFARLEINGKTEVVKLLKLD